MGSKNLGVISASEPIWCGQKNLGVISASEPICICKLPLLYARDRNTKNITNSVSKDQA